MFEKTALPQIIIIGAGFAGLTVAHALKKYKLEITLIDKQNHHVFQPFLYQVACGDLSPSDISIPIRSEFENKPNVHVLMDTVVAIHKNIKQITTKNFTLNYDYLIIATGSKENYFGHDKWSKYCYSLKSMDDALKIRGQILTLLEKEELKQAITPKKDQPSLILTIIGGGPTGVEMAGSLAELRNYTVKKDFNFIAPESIEIVLIEAAPRLLSSFDKKLSDYTYQALVEQNVKIQLNTTVKEIQKNVIEMEPGWRIHSDMIIWAAGVKANTIDNWQGLGIEKTRGDRIKVNPDLSLPGADAIFALGDIAEVVSGESPSLPALAAVATQQGSFVAKVILDRIANRTQPRKFAYINSGEMAVIRKYKAIAQFERIKLKGMFAWLVWWFVHIYFLIGFRNRVVVFINWLWSLVTLGKSNRLIIHHSQDEE